ncbi:hypothetical protein C0991_000963 [Blastosporella zonata]|nr:hypothetical protein C0991_000963 [Blastosporella zonata]
MALATVELLCNTPISTYSLYLNATLTPIYKWQGWSNLHFDWYDIDTFPSVLWRWNPVEVAALELSRWSLVFCAFVFFAFFGFADESRKHYRLAYWAIAKRFGAVPPTSSPSKSNKDAIPSKGFVPMSSTKGSLPLFVTRPPPKVSVPRASFPSSVGRNSFHKSDYTASIYPSPPQYQVDLSIPPSPSSPSSSHDHSREPIEHSV